jgi:hypothetical protein
VESSLDERTGLSDVERAATDLLGAGDGEGDNEGDARTLFWKFVFDGGGDPLRAWADGLLALRLRGGGQVPTGEFPAGGFVCTVTGDL